MKSVVITGANRGIGLELTKQFLDNGSKVYATFRSDSGGLEQIDNPNLNTYQLDVRDGDLIQKLVESIGAETDEEGQKKMFEEIRRQDDDVDTEQMDRVREERQISEDSETARGEAVQQRNDNSNTGATGGGGNTGSRPTWNTGETFVTHVQAGTRTLEPSGISYNSLTADMSKRFAVLPDVT